MNNLSWVHENLKIGAHPDVFQVNIKTSNGFAIQTTLGSETESPISV